MTLSRIASLVGVTFLMCTLTTKAFAAAGAIDFTDVVYKDGQTPPVEQTVVFDATTKVAPIPNTAVTKIIKIRGSYAPKGDGAIWIATVKVGTHGPYAATFDQMGTWSIEVPANALPQNTNYNVQMITATRNGVPVPLPDDRTLSIGNPG